MSFGTAIFCAANSKFSGACDLNIHQPSPILIQASPTVPDPRKNCVANPFNLDANYIAVLFGPSFFAFG